MYVYINTCTRKHAHVCLSLSVHACIWPCHVAYIDEDIHMQMPRILTATGTDPRSSVEAGELQEHFNHKDAA